MILSYLKQIGLSVDLCCNLQIIFSTEKKNLIYLIFNSMTKPNKMEI